MYTLYTIVYNVWHIQQCVFHNVVPNSLNSSMATLNASDLHWKKACHCKTSGSSDLILAWFARDQKSCQKIWYTFNERRSCCSSFKSNTLNSPFPTMHRKLHGALARAYYGLKISHNCILNDFKSLQISVYHEHSVCHKGGDRNAGRACFGVALEKFAKDGQRCSLWEVFSKKFLQRTLTNTKMFGKKHSVKFFL